MTLYEKIIKLLQFNEINYKEIRHAPVRTSIEAAKVRGSSEREGAKSLVFLADKKPINVVLEGNKQVDKEKLKAILQVEKLKMAGHDQVLEIAGVEVGGVPPFGNLFDQIIPVYLNKTFLSNKYMEFNAGDRSISLRMLTKDWQKIVPHHIASFSV